MSDIATLLILTGALDADKTGRGDGRGGGRRRGNIQAWICVPPSQHVWGTAGWKNTPGDAGWPRLSYCQEAEISLLPRLLWTRLLPRFGGSLERCQHIGRKLRRDLLPRHSLLGLEGLVESAPPVRQQRLGGLGDPKHASQPPLKPSKHALSPPDTLLDPNVLCHQEPGTEPAFFISSHLLWQPRVCLVFTSQDAWILSLLDHTCGVSQCFPSSADIFLVMTFPPQPFPWSSPRSNRAAPAVDV